MANKGYHSYRGRRGGGKSFLILLLVLVLLLACGFIFMQRYISYADDGTIQLHLPFFGEEEPDAPDGPVAPEEQEMNLIIDEPETPDEGTSFEEEEPPEPVVEVRRLLGMASLPTDAAALKAELELAGANGFVCALRDNTGRVFYDSAAALRSAVTTPVSMAALQELCALEDTVSVARLNCFHDSYYAWANMESAGICQSTGYIWYDNISYHWLEPQKEKAREYVIGLALECAQMGFDEILLEEMCYPSSGKLNKIDYSGNALEKPEALAGFLMELRQALAPYDTEISLLLDQRLLAPEENEEYIQASGQELAKLLPLVDAVYVSAEDAAAAGGVLAAAAGEEALPRLVPITDAAVPEGSWYMP